MYLQGGVKEGLIELTNLSENPLDVEVLQPQF